MSKKHPANTRSFVARTRWQYYGATAAGGVVLLCLLSWCTLLAFHGGFNLWPFLIVIVLLLGLLQAVISFFSSMKTVEVGPKGLVVSYLFQKHQNFILFSEVVAMKLKPDNRGRNVLRSLTESFTLTLSDGRSFEFTRSQFNEYRKLKEVCRSACRNK